VNILRIGLTRFFVQAVLLAGRLRALARKTAAADPHPPKGKYTILTTIAEKYTHNIGYPGTMNPAMDEVFSTFLIPQMFAQVSQGKMSAAQSVASIKSQVQTIYKKWEARGAV